MLKVDNIIPLWRVCVHNTLLIWNYPYKVGLNLALPNTLLTWNYPYKVCGSKYFREEVMRGWWKDKIDYLILSFFFFVIIIN